MRYGSARFYTDYVLQFAWLSYLYEHDKLIHINSLNCLLLDFPHELFIFSNHFLLPMGGQVCFMLDKEGFFDSHMLAEASSAPIAMLG